MDLNTIYIKNMVCPRCIEVVNNISNELNIDIKDIKLGKLESYSEINEDLKLKLGVLLKQRGFEILEDNNKQIVEQIKSLIITQIHHSKASLSTNFSEYIATTLHHKYTSLSRLFSSLEGTTIERYILKQKVEHVKELLFYKEYTLSEIAYQMNYSSVAHLSSQFKKETGMSPSQFKKIKEPKHKPLDSI
ncbi:hypothetical protein GCM10022291_33120 [Postechiella marina]|uniref:HTH araC/xylS-type domain-containing protein n=1 Tax=Postechiella marina TaxID=943941 RepID=A0ABP8CI25_9FLAO